MKDEKGLSSDVITDAGESILAEFTQIQTDYSYLPKSILQKISLLFSDNRQAPVNEINVENSKGSGFKFFKVKCGKKERFLVAVETRKNGSKALRFSKEDMDGSSSTAHKADRFLAYANSWVKSWNNPHSYIEIVIAAEERPRQR